MKKFFLTISLGMASAILIISCATQPTTTTTTTTTSEHRQLSGALH